MEMGFFFLKQNTLCKLKTDPVSLIFNSVFAATSSFGDFLPPWSPAEEEGEKPIARYQVLGEALRTMVEKGSETLAVVAVHA